MTPEGVAERIIRQHLVEGDMRPGEEIAIRIDHTLTQDASGTIADLQFEALGLPRVRNELAVSYVDHNMLQASFENADDHRFLRTFAARYGLLYSRPGNGICHQVQLERFSVPGKTLLGSDSHTPTSGGIGAIAIGAGGLDVAVAMAGEAFHLAMPRVVAVTLRGRMPAWVSAKDVILELLRRLTVKGGVGKIFEYRGPGLADLSVPERATVANMGAELGATTSIFPSDDVTLRYLRAQGRPDAWTKIAADEGASYDDEVLIDLDRLEPLIALPGRPDRVVPVRDVAGRPIEQVAIGSCTNSSYRDLLVVAKILEGQVVHPAVSLTVTPGSRQAFLMAEVSGAVENFIEAGARVLESACGPCIGMGQAPASGSGSLRSFNRNFTGRSGTADADLYLAGPEVCAAAAITGRITDPRDLGLPYPSIDAIPARYVIDDRMIVMPPADGSSVEILRGPNIRPLPVLGPLPDRVDGPVLIALGDDVTTDDILPAGAEVLPLRSNIPSISRFAFVRVDREFALRAKAAGQGIVVGGRNYGQGSAREHAALVPRYLGVAAILAVTFARIHRANLINFGVLPLTFADPADHALLTAGETVAIEGIRDAVGSGRELRIRRSGGDDVVVRAELTPREREIVLAGGLLNVVRTRVTGGMGPKTAGGADLATPAG